MLVYVCQEVVLELEQFLIVNRHTPNKFDKNRNGAYHECQSHNNDPK